MEFSYGQGAYKEGAKDFSGQIILAEHKLFLRDGQTDILETYVPLEKIEVLCKKGSAMTVFVRPSLYFQYEAIFSGEAKHINELVKDIVKRRGLKKKFWKSEWVEVN